MDQIAKPRFVIQLNIRRASGAANKIYTGEDDADP